ncbi:hypothetical protein, partial [Ralstonia pseudosolanacearum]|uniref:hypothetical protein n=1 Tax=Ralstonia pseudosolanacearum TaxID=1310165 RepID=UPI003CF5B958
MAVHPPATYRDDAPFFTASPGKRRAAGPGRHARAARQRRPAARQRRIEADQRLRVCRDAAMLSARRPSQADGHPRTGDARMMTPRPNMIRALAAELAAGHTT